MRTLPVNQPLENSVYVFLGPAEPGEDGRARGWFRCTSCGGGKRLLQMSLMLNATKRAKACRSCSSKKTYEAYAVPKPAPKVPVLQREWQALSEEQKTLAARILMARKDERGKRLQWQRLPVREQQTLLKEAIETAKIGAVELQQGQRFKMELHRSYVENYTGRAI